MAAHQPAEWRKTANSALDGEYNEPRSQWEGLTTMLAGGGGKGGVVEGATDEFVYFISPWTSGH